MATTATIKVEGIKYAKIYKHFDGNPENTLPWLQEFNERFIKERGNDVSYKFAQLLRSSAIDAEKFDLDPSLYTGWGIAEYNLECCEDYEYMLRKDGTVTYSKKHSLDNHSFNY